MRDVGTQGTLARDHERTQGTLASEHVSTQGILTREHVSTQSTLARKARWHVSTFLARRARNLADSSLTTLFFALDIKYHYTCGESNLYENLETLHNSVPVIVE